MTLSLPAIVSSTVFTCFVSLWARLSAFAIRAIASSRAWGPFEPGLHHLTRVSQSCQSSPEPRSWVENRDMRQSKMIFTNNKNVSVSIVFKRQAISQRPLPWTMLTGNYRA